MLGALFGFILICLLYYWWHLLKVFRKYKKGVDEMSKTQFYTFLLLNFGVISLATLMVYSLIPVYSQKFKWLWPYMDIIPVFLQIIPLIISYLIYRQYRKIKNSNNDIITKTETIEM